MIRVFVGYDSHLPALYNVLQHSIHARATKPVAVIPIILSQLKGVYNRERHPLASTEFSFSRFLVPHLSCYEGWSLFIDNDFLALDDVSKLWELKDDRYSVMCTKHQYHPVEETKFLNTVQTKYEKKNWSSCMLFNNAKCRALTPDYVNSASGLELHQFKWLESDVQIGEIPLNWNYLVGSDTKADHVSFVHYTSGGPYFKEFCTVEYAEEWFRERDDMVRCMQAG